jgi:uncharacterized membrane protein
VNPIAPSREDAFVAGAARLVGGPMGAHASGRWQRWWTPLRIVLILTMLTSVAGYLQKAPCRTHPWSDEYQYTRVCYTDVFALYYAEGLGGSGASRLGVPYRDHPVEYPAVIGGLMWVAAEATNALHPDDPHLSNGQVVDNRGATFFDVTALMLALAALLTTFALAHLAGRTRVWDAAMFALAPTLFFHAYTNWDLAAVALTMLGMWAWSRSRPIVAGVLIGVGVATKLYPVLILLALLLCAARAGRLRAWLLTAGASVVGFCLAYLPAWVLTRPFPFPDASCPTARPLSAWRFFWSLNQTRVADWDSLWFLLEHLRGKPLDAAGACGSAPAVLNGAVAVAGIAVVGACSLLVLAAPRRPRVMQIAFLLVAGFLLVNKVDSPQYVLWLVPLAVLARPRWPAFLAWQAAEVVLLLARFYYFVGNDKPGQGVPIDVFFTTVVIRDVALVVLMALVVREVFRPELDVVRRDGVDDPAGGPLDGARDRWAPTRPTKGVETEAAGAAARA